MHYGEKGSMACAVLYLLLPQWLCHITGVSCIYHKQIKNPVFAQTEIHVSFQDCSPSVLPCVFAKHCRLGTEHSNRGSPGAEPLWHGGYVGKDVQM